MVVFAILKMKKLYQTIDNSAVLILTIKPFPNIGLFKTWWGVRLKVCLEQRLAGRWCHGRDGGGVEKAGWKRSEWAVIPGKRLSQKFTGKKGNSLNPTGGGENIDPDKPEIKLNELIKSF